MRNRIWHTAVIALLIGAPAGLTTTQSQASGLIDWMSRCGQPAEPQIVGYPMSTVYQVSATECCEPALSYQSPDATCCAPAVVYQPQRSFWQRMGACSASPPAQTRYRTSWKKVPVTSYRPAMSTDPVTGCPVTVMKPCTTYTWQADRVGCGLFSRFFGGADPPAPEVQYCVPTTCCEPNAYAVSSGCYEPSTAPSPTPAPYYAPGPPSVLTVPPGSAAPTPTLAPGPPPAIGGAFPGAQPPTAADVRPSLKPADVAPEGSTAFPPPPIDSPWDSAPANPAGPDAQDLQSLPTLGPPLVDPDNSRLNPVPDPKATPVSPVEPGNPPQLLNPRDQVASLRTGQRWAVTPIVWSGHRHPSADQAPADQVPTDRRPAVSARRDLREWDESGWQSARKAP